jgi:hypothetical protein
MWRRMAYLLKKAKTASERRETEAAILARDPVSLVKLGDVSQHVFRQCNDFIRKKRLLPKIGRAFRGQSPLLPPRGTRNIMADAAE